MTRADYVALALALALLPWLYITYWGNGSQGERVQVKVAGGETVTLPLDYDKQVKIEGARGTSIIEIKNRQVRFIDSPCKSKRCVISGWVKEDGDTTACMPNGVTIQMVGKDSRFDSVAY